MLLCAPRRASESFLPNPSNTAPTWFPVLAAALISRISFSSSRRSAKISRSMSVG